MARHKTTVQPQDDAVSEEPIVQEATIEPAQPVDETMPEPVDEAESNADDDVGRTLLDDYIDLEENPDIRFGLEVLKSAGLTPEEKAEFESMDATFSEGGPNVLATYVNDLIRKKGIYAKVEESIAKKRAAQQAEEEAVIAKLPTFKKQFGKLVEAEQKRLIEYGKLAKETTDPEGHSQRFLRLGELATAFMTAQKISHGDKYSRKSCIKDLELVGRLYGVPDGSNRPNDWIAAYQLVKQVQSEPPTGIGNPRSYAAFKANGIPANFCRGNLNYAAIRELAPCVYRSGSGRNTPASDAETDSWEFSEKWEAWTRQVVGRLQDGDINAFKLRALYIAKKAEIAQQEKRKAQAGKSKEEIASMKRRSIQANNRKNLEDLGNMIATAFDFAGEKLGYEEPAFEEFLRDKLYIPAKPRYSHANLMAMASLAIPSDARDFVQQVARLAETDANKVPVRDALIRASNEITRNLEKSQGDESQPTIPMKSKVG